MSPRKWSSAARLETYEDYIVLGKSLKLTYEQAADNFLVISRRFGKLKEVSHAAERVVVANHDLRSSLDSEVALLFPDRFTGHEFFGPTEGQKVGRQRQASAELQGSMTGSRFPPE